MVKPECMVSRYEFSYGPQGFHVVQNSYHTDHMCKAALQCEFAYVC